MRTTVTCLSILIAGFAMAQAPPTIANPEMDALVAAHFDGAAAPGACVLVAKGGEVIYRRATGTADLARPMSTDAVFRIGSVTKQFTAVAILQLVEKGKLRLEDEVHTWLDLPRKQYPFTIAQLLTHTAGVPNYTDLPSFIPATYVQDASLQEVIATFADLPLQFEPDTRWNYSNSGYILLGAIIEKVSGMTWENYMRDNVFTPLGMKHTSASARNGPLPKEVAGFAKGDKGWEPAVPLSMTWPHAAGAIRSTVDDLFIWNSAVMAATPVSKDLLARAHRDHTLKDGSATHYGYGWSFLNVQGRPTIEHNGGINGFVSASLYLPTEDIYVAVLCNGETNAADALAPELAAVAMGQPYGGPVVPVPIVELKELEGVYMSADSTKRYITADDEGLHAQREGSSVSNLRCFAPDAYIYENDVITLSFQRKEGKVTGARFRSRRKDEDLVRTDLPLPVRTAVKLDPAMLSKYAGEYELAPGFTLTFRVEGDRFFAQATGQPEFEVFAEGPDRFFLKVVDARIEFYPEADGSVKRMTLFQGGEMEGKRIR